MRWLTSLYLLIFAGTLAAQAQAIAQSTASLKQIVEPAIPQLQWTPSATMATGDSLSPLELNATASVPGTYSYTPGAGTVLPVGQQSLNVVFTPSNTNYAVVTQTATIQVLDSNGATFAIAIAATTSPVVQTGQYTDATQQVSVTPIGVLNQAVHFSCNATPGVVCTFTPNEVRPGSTTIPVQLTIRLPNFLLLHATVGGFFPILCVLPLLRKHRVRTIVCLTLGCLCIALNGCSYPRPLYVTVLASTSTETRTLPLDLHQIEAAVH